MAAENHKLVQNAAQSKLPQEADKMVKRFSVATEMDRLNVAVFGITAGEWRRTFKPKNAKDNMRNYATEEELKVMAHLQHISARYIEHTADPELRLALLLDEANRLFDHFCDNDEKKEDLAFMKAKRGW